MNGAYELTVMKRCGYSRIREKKEAGGRKAQKQACAVAPKIRNCQILCVLKKCAAGPTIKRSFRINAGVMAWEAVQIGQGLELDRLFIRALWKCNVSAVTVKAHHQQAEKRYRLQRSCHSGSFP